MGWEKLEITTRYSSTASFNWGETSAEGKEEGAGGGGRARERGMKEREREKTEGGGRREEEMCWWRDVEDADTR